MTNIGGLYDAVNQATNAANTAASQEKKAKKTLDKDDFLQLFITQLVHQNPMEPLDNDQFIAQMSQFTAIEQATNSAQSLEKLVTAQEENNELLSMLLYSQVEHANKQMFESAALIGRTVIAQKEDQDPVQGVVARVTMNQGLVELQMENGHIFSITEVLEISG